LLPELKAPAAEAQLAVPFEDFSGVPFSPGKVAGGAGVLTAQSQCPFKAFATARLAAQGWEPAEAGLTSSQRGQLLHAVLHAVWAGPPDGIRTHAELQSLTNQEAGCPRSGFSDLVDHDPLQAFVVGHVQRAFARALLSHLRERMPRRYLELEEQRLAGLVTEWLDYEAARVDFEVAATEVKRTVSVAGLTLDLRLDRIDRLQDGSQLVIDYKSGSVSPSSWNLPRPDDVQLPLYAGFALDRDHEYLGGLVFAKVRAGDLAFAGRVFDPAATLFANLKGTSPLVKNSLTLEQLLGWRDCVEQLARDFLDGRAEVNPREHPRPCERCGLQTLCRIQEHQIQIEDEDDFVSSSNGEEAGDE
jgi:ATP-dependent helicase/DNAse subunit B